MSSTMIKVFIAALAAVSVHAAPYQPPAAPAPAPAPPAGPDFDLLFELRNAPTQVARFQKLFAKDRGSEVLLSPEEYRKNIVFDFADGATKSDGGQVKSANIGTFPVLTDLGIAVTVATLGPCGINTPHVHPRATEFLTVTEGEVIFGMNIENGLVKDRNQEITGKLGRLQGTVFPQGSIHYQFNPTCHDTTFVAALSNEDPGTGQVAQNFLGLNDQVVRATLGFGEQFAGADIEKIRGLVPANLARDTEQCLRACGIAKRSI